MLESNPDQIDDADKNSRQWINPEKAIKNMKWIVFYFFVIAVIIAFLVQFYVNDELDLQNATSLSIEIIFGIFISLVVYVYSKKMDQDNTKLQTESQKRIEHAVEQTSKIIVQKVVEIANAQLRVGEGGQIALRNGNVGAALVRIANEDVSIPDTINQFINNLNHIKPVAENHITHKTDSYVVAEQKSTFGVDTIVVNSPEKDIETIRNEIKELKINVNEYLQNTKTSKKSKNTLKKKTKNTIKKVD